MRVRVQLCAVVLLLSASEVGAMPPLSVPKPELFRPSIELFRDATDRVRLLEAEVERVRDRAAWARRMAARGYLTTAQAKTDELWAAKAELSLRDARRALQSLSRGGAAPDPKELLRDAGEWVKLAEADLEQARERAAWAKRMVMKGYMTAAQAKTDELMAVRAELALRDARRRLEALSREVKPKK